MNKLLNPILNAVIILFLASACIQNPESVKVAKPINDNSSEAANSFKNESEFTPSPVVGSPEVVHTVIVKEILEASRYVYLKVSEGGDEFWIAARKQNIAIGSTYYYKRAILKTNFESKENNKLFDKIYLVSSLVPASHGNQTNTESPSKILPKEETSTTSAPAIQPVVTQSKPVQEGGTIKIAYLIENAKQFEGKVVELSGVCVKVNANIMNRNWIHIKDGSRDDFDLVITTKAFVPEGTKIKIKGKVALNKDFGAGYSYDLILEEGVIIN